MMDDWILPALQLSPLVGAMWGLKSSEALVLCLLCNPENELGTHVMQSQRVGTLGHTGNGRAADLLCFLLVCSTSPT